MRHGLERLNAQFAHLPRLRRECGGHTCRGSWVSFGAYVEVSTSQVGHVGLQRMKVQRPRRGPWARGQARSLGTQRGSCWGAVLRPRAESGVGNGVFRRCGLPVGVAFCEVTAISVAAAEMGGRRQRCGAARLGVRGFVKMAAPLQPAARQPSDVGSSNCSRRQCLQRVAGGA